MARPSKRDGSIYPRNDGKVLWMVYRDRNGKRIRESTFTEDWEEAQRKLRQRLQEGTTRSLMLIPMTKEQIDLENAVVWIPDSKTPNGIAEVPLTDLALEAFREQIRISGMGAWLFPSDGNPSGHQKTLKTVWHATLRRAKVPYFRICDLRSTYATR